MMDVKFLSPTKFEIKDGKHTIISDQPKSVGGSDEGMNPIDIMIGSLGACIAIFMTHLLVRRNVDLEKCRIKLDYEMADNPRRVGNINVKLQLPDGLKESDRKAILKAANLCSIHNTLHNSPDISIGFE